MIVALRLLGFRGVVAILAIAVAVLLAVRIDWLTDDRESARTELSSVRTDLAIAEAHNAFLERARATAIVALETERTRAVAAERKASLLREQIVRDAGTSRDAPTAPVLRDVIEGLQRTATRQDELFLGRMHPFFRLVVLVDGKRDRSQDVRGFQACRDLAAAAAIDLAKRPELVANVRRVSIRCDAIPQGDRT